MKIGFVIGPYRSDTLYGIKRNIDEAEKLAVELAYCNVFMYVPHKNTAFFDGIASDELWLEGNLELLRRGIADFAVVGFGWQHSSGSGGEIKECHSLGIPVFYREDPSYWVQIEQFLKKKIT